jgi:hypothetical protein
MRRFLIVALELYVGDHLAMIIYLWSHPHLKLMMDEVYTEDSEQILILNFR